MLSTQMLQNTIDGLRQIFKYEISVIEIDGKIVASTEEEMLNKQNEHVGTFILSQAENQLVLGYQYFKVYNAVAVEYVIALKGEDDEAFKFGKIAAFHLQMLLEAYKERYDNDHFFRNLLLDNLLLIDIYSRSKKLKIDNNVTRIVYLISADMPIDLDRIEVVKKLRPVKAKDFITVIDEKNIVLLKELGEKNNEEYIEGIAGEIANELRQRLGISARIAIGSAVSDLKDISNSYKEAKMTIDIGRIFKNDKKIVNYRHLGLGRLIYQLPETLCEIFLNEAMNDTSFDMIDDETLESVELFLANSLNVSETARQLFVHRNTLVYRLAKVMKLTGLDLRVFDDAVTFKIAQMIHRFLTDTD